MGMWCGSWFCLAKPTDLVVLVWETDTFFTALDLQEYCRLGKKNLSEKGLNYAADNTVAVDHGCMFEFFFFF